MVGGGCTIWEEWPGLCQQPRFQELLRILRLLFRSLFLPVKALHPTDDTSDVGGAIHFVKSVTFFQKVTNFEKM